MVEDQEKAMNRSEPEPTGAEAVTRPAPRDETIESPESSESLESLQPSESSDFSDSSEPSEASESLESSEPQEDSESLESLNELRERTAETMAEARKDVDRAMATSHDQILPAAQSGEVGDYEDEEGVPEKDDTRGAWPDWTKRE